MHGWVVRGVAAGVVDKGEKGVEGAGLPLSFVDLGWGIFVEFGRFGDGMLVLAATGKGAAVWRA